jgi:histidinol dehydrogenase
MDLFSQAEHDELAQAILLSPDAAFLDQVYASIQKLVQTMPRKDIISTSLADRGALIQVRDMDEAAEICNYIAPEHLELSMDDPLAFSKKIKHAGAIFMGRDTCEALGDYCAGPNHVSSEGAQTLGKVASTLAHGEGLQAHAQSAEYRLKK